MASTLSIRSADKTKLGKKGLRRTQIRSIHLLQSRHVHIVRQSRVTSHKVGLDGLL